MTTKPEGPAQEPQCPMCGYTRADAQLHMDHHLCKNAGNAPWEATPVPSQPAAREPWMEAAMEEIALLYIRSVVTKEQVDGVAVIARHYAQQTAAKDAEIADLRRQRDLEWDSRKAASSGRIAAERERDSLRKFLASEIHNDKCDCLKCIRIRKALKAGKV